MNNQNNQTVSFKKGKEPRNQLELPTLHFVVTDQWIDKIGEKAFLSWLRMYSWCDRSNNSESEINLWEQAKIPTSYSKVIKRLGIGKDTFYNKILKPLWNVGLIDIEEYEESDSKGTKPMNIIVYKYPQNNKSLAYQPIEQVRDYDKDYHSNAKTFAKKGGRPKNDSQQGSEIEPLHIDSINTNSTIYRGSEIEPGGVLKQNPGGFSNRTEDGSEIGHNNILNNINKSFNSHNNNLNNINNSFKNREEEEKENNKEINPFVIQFLKNELEYDDYMVNDIIKHMNENHIAYFTKEQMIAQHNRTIIWIKENKKEIREYGFFFVNGILKHEASRKIIKKTTEQEILAKQKEEQRKQQFSPFPMYNWLEEN